MEVAQKKNTLKIFALKIGLTHEELIRQSLISFIFDKLKELKKEIFLLQIKYNVNTIFDFEKFIEECEIDDKTISKI
ncbi:MAG: hypothetical protein B6I24_08370 [Bacteroidetes bacterium 4572_128]|nr:MAG: hypothetical protein B6I24_08370 [Bacteroidetes bacterium 4572_128]